MFKKFTTLQALMRMSTVRRWHIIEMKREQSLAEHSYRVWALSVDLYHTMFPVDHNTPEFMDLQMHALLHDTEEICTGDVNSMFKGMIERLAPGVFERARAEVLRDIDLGPLSLGNRVKGSVVEVIVEIADLTEAMLYFAKYGVDDPNIQVKNFQVKKMGEIFKTARSQFPQHEWDRVAEWVERMTHATARGQIPMVIEELKL